MHSFHLARVPAGATAVALPRPPTGRTVPGLRRDFHHEFTTLRFRPLSEHGSWEGRAGLVPAAAHRPADAQDVP